VRVVCERHWHAVGAGFLAVTAFASLLGIATILHWGKFSHDHASFWAWAGLYFTAPFLVIGAWLVNRRYGAPVTAGDVVLTPAQRTVVAALGLVSLVQGVVMFVAPSTMIGSWPWPLTPLTARVVAATFCLGAAGLGTWFDPRWSSLRVMVQVEAIMLSLMLLAAARAHDEIDPGRPLTWMLLGGVLLMLAGSAYLWVSYEARSPRVASTA
jgi:hypothetical protein